MKSDEAVNKEQVIGVTVVVPTQIGYETYKDKFFTKVFSDKATFREMVEWGAAIKPNLELTDLIFSEISQDEE